jgi:hypothetical protein
MVDGEWLLLLSTWNQYELSVPRDAKLEPAVLASGSLGFPGASEAEIQAAEARLGITLPPSYRSFLLVSNGWRTTEALWSRLASVAEIDWFRRNHQTVIDAFLGPFRSGGLNVPDDQYFVYGDRQDPAHLRPEYLSTALLVSADAVDSETILLNPRIVSPDGEWEAWFFAHWLPGAVRYQSFWHLIEGQLRVARES